MTQAIREFFLSRSYIEVDTPIRLPVLIPEAEIIPIPSGDSFLQTSPELCMKRLLGRGNSRLFQICHCFRQGEIGRQHQEEFTMLEWYQCGWTYLELMQECEELIAAVARRLIGDFLERNGKTIPLAPPWQRLTVDDAFYRYAGISAVAAVEQGLFDELLVEKVEPALGWQQPVFLYDYPLALASLARPKKDNPGLAERFELYIGGLELANGFSELTDVDVQQHRFAEEIDRAEKNGRRTAMPEKFLQSLARLPECAGIALGLDRLLMLLLARGDIADVLPFAADEL
jgi:lysyl-tRNA synthetase class 2